MSKAESKSLLVRLARKFLSDGARRRVVDLQREHNLVWPRTGRVKMADLRRLKPISPVFGMERGKPIDRYYIDRFLEANSAFIKWRCLELGDASYIKAFGTEVTQIEVLHVVAGNPDATIVADLTDCPHIPDDSFDCIIFTQALQMIYDMRAAMTNLYRILKPGGCVLLTTHGTSKIARRLGKDDWGEYWRLTGQGLEALTRDCAPDAQIDMTVYGNVLSCAAFLYGLAAEDLKPVELDAADDDFELIIGARITKPGV